MRAGGILGIASAAGVALAFVLTRALRGAGDAIDEAFGDVPTMPEGMVPLGKTRRAGGARPNGTKARTQGMSLTHSGGGT